MASTLKQHIQQISTSRQGMHHGKRDQLHDIDYKADDYDKIECFDPDMDSQFENFVIETLDVNQNGIKDKIHVTAVIDNTSFELKVYSGAKCNVISTETIKSLALCKKSQLNTKKKVKPTAKTQSKPWVCVY